MTRLCRPDFFIVGAPKCGTTSLNSYLGQHPEIFMATKEQHFFGSDLADLRAQPTSEQYLASFAGSEWATRRGEASGWYLLSNRAAEEIYEFDPDARIIAMVRNPLEMLPSLHSQYLYDGIENITSLADALAAEGARRRGRQIPVGNGPDPRRLFYRDVICFHVQLARYFRVFGRERVHVVVFDDFVADTESAYRDVARFLGVDPGFVPAIDVLNPNKRMRSRRVDTAIHKWVHDSPGLRRVAHHILPAPRARQAVIRGVHRLNTSFAPRPGVDPVLRRRLARECEPAIVELSALLGRDLLHWCAPHDSLQACRAGSRSPATGRA